MSQGEWFYPHKKPADTYSYTADFVQESAYHGEEAKSHVMAEAAAVGGGISSSNEQLGSALVELSRMIIIARTAEQTFLTDHNLKFPGNDWNQLITGINKILSTEAAFKRNVQLISQVNNGTDNTYQDVSTFFIGKLKSAILEEIHIDINASVTDIMVRAVRNAIDKMSNMTDTKMKNGKIVTQNPDKTDKNQQALQAFSELFGVIKLWQGYNFLQEINELFGLEQYITNVRNEILHGTYTKAPSLTYQTKQGNKGTLAEILYSAVVNGLGSGGVTWKVEHTGAVDYKPDRVLGTVDITYNQSVENIKHNGINYGRSKRAPGIAVMEDMYKQLQNAKGEIVLISDKNYIINQAFRQHKGFKAQDSSSLNALDSLFNALEIKGLNFDALINYLANVGSNMVVTSVDQSILDAISSQIGNFLFDDLSFSGIPTGTNVVHVFNLSGIYMPLSIVLEGVYNGLMGVQGADLSAYVDVHVKASGDTPPAWKKDESSWTSFRNTKMANNKVTVHFLRDFASIISQYVNI